AFVRGDISFSSVALIAVFTSLLLMGTGAMRFIFRAARRPLPSGMGRKCRSSFPVLSGEARRVLCAGHSGRQPGATVSHLSNQTCTGLRHVVRCRVKCLRHLPTGLPSTNLWCSALLPPGVSGGPRVARCAGRELEAQAPSFSYGVVD